LSSKEQQKWVAKMQGLDLEIIHKKGKDNVVANALSRIEEASILYSMTSSILVWLEEAHHEWKNDDNTRQKKKKKSKERGELYGTLGVKERYTLVQG
jgi:hypothetical protein